MKPGELVNIFPTKPGQRCFVRWDLAPVSFKHAKFVRGTAGGRFLLRVEKVDAKGKPTGKFGSPRAFYLDDIFGRAPKAVRS